MLSLASLHRAWVFALFIGLRAVAQDGGADGGVVQDAPAPFSSTLYATCPEAPPVIMLDGGFVLLPPARAARNACLLATCESDRLAKEKTLEAPPAWWVVASSTATALAGGAFLLGRFTAPPTK